MRSPSGCHAAYSGEALGTRGSSGYQEGSVFPPLGTSALGPVVSLRVLRSWPRRHDSPPPPLPALKAFHSMTLNFISSDDHPSPHHELSLCQAKTRQPPCPLEACRPVGEVREMTQATSFKKSSIGRLRPCVERGRGGMKAELKRQQHLLE